MSIFESNHLRAFSEKLQRHDYARFYYQIICESFEKEVVSGDVHSLIRQIWCISQLDTINRYPKEARSRMPNASINGLLAPNLAYDTARSESYRQWIKNPFARAAGDIIMDAFHFVVDFGSSLDIDQFLNRFDLYLRASSSGHIVIDIDYLLNINEMIAKPISEDAHEYYSSTHEYDDFMTPFSFYLLENVFEQVFVSDGRSNVVHELLKISGNEENLRRNALNTLTAFKSFSNNMLDLRPSGEPLKKEDTVRGLVFGIGFNGPLFDSPSRTLENKNEIYLTFSDSGRKNGGYLLLTLIKEIVRQRSSKLKTQLLHAHSVNSIFKRYKSLIRHNAAYLKTQRPFLIDKDLVVTDLEADIAFEQLNIKLRDWIANPDNWFYIPFDISIKIPDEMPVEEYKTQELTREILFDAITQIRFSETYSELMPFAFRHWKNKLLDYLSSNKKILSHLASVNELRDVDSQYIHSIFEGIDHIIWDVHPVFQLVWNPVIEKFFQKFIEESDPEIKNQTELLDGFNKKKFKKKKKNLKKHQRNIKKK